MSLSRSPLPRSRVIVCCDFANVVLLASVVAVVLRLRLSNRIIIISYLCFFWLSHLYLLCIALLRDPALRGVVREDDRMFCVTLLCVKAWPRTTT